MSSGAPAHTNAALPSVLVVDDRADDLRALASLLESPEYRVITAASGQEGLREILRHDFAVIILDMVMPGMNGLEFAGLVRGRERSRATPVIFLTAAEGDMQTLHRAYALGAVDYLIKPPDQTVLRAKVSVFVDLYRKEQRIREQAELLAQAAMREQELRIAEERKLSERRYRSLVEMVPACVIQTDPLGKVQYANQAFLALSGVDCGKLLSEGIWSHIHPDEEKRLSGEWRQGREERKAFRTEARMLTADGEYRWHLCDFVPEFNEEGTIRGWLAFFADCEELKRAVTSRDEFLAIASHELRNPLTPVSNSLYILKEVEPGSEQAKRAITVIERQVGHMCRLVEDMLDVSRIARGKVQLQRVRMDLGDQVCKVGEDHRPTLAAAGIELSVVVPGQPIWIEADLARIAQVLGNLLTNARKFTPRGGHVELSLEQQDGCAVVRVKDSGVGMSADLLARVFEPFTQGDRTLDRSSGGLGLGLAVVKGLIELHGGKVSATSDGPGLGSAFTLTLPTCVAKEEAVAPPPTKQRPMRSRRILLVEDNPDSARSLREVLELMGHQVDVGRDGAEGIAVAQRFGPEVVLCDIGLPGMDGYEVAKHIRNIKPDAALVALTGYAHPADQERATEAGFTCHVSKPPSLDDLQQLLFRI